MRGEEGREVYIYQGIQERRGEGKGEREGEGRGCIIWQLG